LKGPRDDMFIERINTERIRQKLQDINGVADSEIFGGRERSVDVTIFQDRLREFNIPMWQVMNKVQSFASEPVFLGDVAEGPMKYFVRLDGQFGHPSEIEDVVVRDEANIALRHLANVEETYRSRRYLGRMDGKPALRVDMEKEALVNPIELSNRTRKVVDEINETLPEGYELSIIWDQADEIKDILKTLSKLGMMGIILSMLVLYLFIRNVRMALIICLVIPICIVATFNGMYFSGMSINIISLLGLVVGIGCLIDSSIVVLENIFRHHEKGKDAFHAAIVGSQEVGLAVFALTLTNVLVFLPIVFVEGEIRLVFTEGALAIIYPMIISMFVALSLVPMATSKVFQFIDKAKGLRMNRLMASGVSEEQALLMMSAETGRFDGVKKTLLKIPHPQMSTMRKKYGTILKSCLRHRVRFLLAIILVILYTVYYTTSEVNRDVLSQPEDRENFYMFLYMPNGTKQEATLNVVAKVEDMLMEQVPEAEHYNCWVRDDFAQFRIDLKDIKERDRESPTIKEDLRVWMENFGEAELTFSRSRSRGESQPPPVDTGRSGVIEIRGPEYEQLSVVAENFVEVLKQQVTEIRDAEPQTERGTWEILFKLDREAASYMQIDAQQVARSIQNAQRRAEYSTIEMKKGDDEIDIIFAQYENRNEFEKAQSEGEQWGIVFEELKQVPVYSPLLNSTISLEELGKFDVVRGLGGVQRENRQRISKIVFNTAPNANFGDIEEQIKNLIEVYPVPAGYTLTLGGRTRQMNEEFKAFKIMIWLAGILVYMCIASLFESFILPLVIMGAIPLAVIGVVWAYIITGTQFDPLAILGCAFLVGILPNSSILLIHFSGYLRREKFYPRERAIMVSGYTRLRPIFMTVTTTILGLLPMAIQWRGDDEWVPFAVTVIGGLASSTVLTLLIVPGFYFILEDLAALAGRGVRYCTSWRWLFIFWSKKRRTALREELTLYRKKEVREEPLRVEIDHLTRIYSPPRLDSLITALKPMVRLMRPTPALGFVPESVAQGSRLSTRSRKKALDMISLTMEQGLFGLLGPNGAGKTTLLRLLAGIDQPTRGYLSICGYDMKTEMKQAQKLIGYLPQNFGVYSHMTAIHYLDYFALLKGMKHKAERNAAIQNALEMANLSDQAHVPVGQFSGGMMRRIGLAQIFVRPPKVLIVDEPTVGLDPMERVRFRNLLSQLSRDRVVILSTHIVEDVAHSCKKVAMMNEGKVLNVGTPEELVASVVGKVWEIVVPDEEEWRAYRHQFQVVSQTQIEEGVRMRIVAEGPPLASAVTVEPSLEDAYLYYTHVKTAD